jgi:hypothetical protein
MEGISPEDWERTPDSVKQLVFTLLETVQKLQKRVEELEDRLGLTPQNSSIPPSTEHPHKKKTTGQKKMRKRGGQKGHPKHERTLIPSDQCEVIPLIPTECRKCGRELTGEDASPHRHQVWELPVIKPEVAEYQQHQLQCAGCQTCTTAPLPQGVSTGQAGPRLTAFAALLMACFRQSKRRTALFLETVMNIPASAAWTVKLQTRCSDSLAGTYGELVDQLPEQDVLRADETPTKEARQKSWLWVFVAQWFTVFSVRPSRGAEVVDEFLKADFAGIVICDRLKSYYHIGQGKGRLQWCWAHLLRDFQSFADSQNETVREIGGELVQQTKSLFRVWNRCRDGTISEAGLKIAVGRIRKVVIEQLEEGLRVEHAKLPGVCETLLHHREWLWTFLDHTDVELTNNASERALRHGVIWRKLSFGTQSQAGSRFVERMLTVIETCRQQKRNVLEFVTESVERHFAGEPGLSLMPVE